MGVSPILLGKSCYILSTEILNIIYLRRNRRARQVENMPILLRGRFLMLIQIGQSATLFGRLTLFRTVSCNENFMK